jgi:F-type H+-transporting ATPase subunit a
LTANITAGHLLLSLLGSSLRLDMAYLIIPVIGVILILLCLEFAVAIIQSYVFVLLSCLYTGEALRV